jgi:hypothetical protein
MYLLAEWILQGRVAGSTSEALKLLRESSDRDGSHATLLLAEATLDGLHGLREDPKEAIRLFRLTGSRGNYTSMRLGDALTKGMAGICDDDEGRPLLETGQEHEARRRQAEAAQERCRERAVAVKNAVQCGDWQALEVLVDRGASVSHPDTFTADGENILHLVAKRIADAKLTSGKPGRDELNMICTLFSLPRWDTLVHLRSLERLRPVDLLPSGGSRLRTLLEFRRGTRAAAVLWCSELVSPLPRDLLHEIAKLLLSPTSRHEQDATRLYATDIHS